MFEAKRPSENINNHHFQIQNYIYNLKLWVGILSNFEQFQVFLVDGQPSKSRPFSPLDGWRLHRSQYVDSAQKIWDAFSRDKVADGSLDRLAQSATKIYRPGKQAGLFNAFGPADLSLICNTCGPKRGG